MSPLRTLCCAEALHDTVVAETLKVPRSVRSTVLDEDVFLAQLQKSLKILKPISTAITTLESDSMLLSGVPYQMGQSKSTAREDPNEATLPSAGRSQAEGLIKNSAKCGHQIIHLLG